ncbi:asparaginase domain-containing protein [Marinomonas transparens]|uniref:asparaginase n=1 Tax=Marinomonas transparens TaxID=2795388 RepID=A0A934JQS6_9GAMM|nr:asparaginase domain-containing protein [Marinomonas transparens]MBJ7538098.1 asparaginase [Marinomonas transparens]
MKIYLAYTGGTIGMVDSDQGLIPDPEFAKVVETMLKNDCPEDSVTVHCYANLIDSSNARPEDWQTIACDIQDNWQDYDAFMVLHGTDTMAYTAAALFYCFQTPTKPIIVTGSQIPLFKARSDAKNNVLGAVDALKNGPNEVSLFFAGRLIAGNRAHKANTTELAAFASPNALLLGLLGIDWQWSRTALLDGSSETKISIPNMTSGTVTILPVFPGVTAEHWQGLLNNKVKGAVLWSYGAGNAPDKDQALLALLKTASERGVVIVNVSQCGAGSVVAGAYAAGSALVEAGVISGMDMTYEAAFVKLSFLIGLGYSSADIRDRFTKTP